MSEADIPILRANWERLLARFGSLPCRRAAPAELTLATPAEAWPEDVKWQRVHDACVDQREDRPPARVRRICGKCREEIPGRECRPCRRARKAAHDAKRRKR